MLLNYLKLAIRLLIRNPFFTFINVLGLSIGLTVFFVLWQYSEAELNADKFHKNWERIYRLGFNWRTADDNQNWHSLKIGFNGTLPPKRIAHDFKEIEEYVRIINQVNYTKEYIPLHNKEIEISVINGKEKFSSIETLTVYADPNLFQFFNIPFLKGDVTNGLQKPESAVLSESIAKKYFGLENPLGKQIILNDSLLFEITGVFKDLPENSHLRFNIVFSLLRLDKYIQKSVPSTGGPHCYFKLTRHTDPSTLTEKINSNIHSYYESLSILPANTTFDLFLQPLSDISFHPVAFDSHTGKDKFFFVSLQVISIIVLLMAWVNYLLLTFSFNKNRIKEYVTRRTLGANGFDLAFQFLTESFLINLIAILTGLTLLQIGRTLIWKLFEFYFPNIEEISIATGLILLTIVLLGIFICALVPVYQLRGYVMRNRTEYLNRRLRMNFLPIGQFTICIVLIIWVTALFKQINFLMYRDLGLNKDEVVVIDLPIIRNQTFTSDLAFLKKELNKIDGVIDLTSSNSVVGDKTFQNIQLLMAGGTHLGFLSNGGVDDRFIPCFKIQMLAGRSFLPENAADKSNIVISERACQRLSYDSPDSAIGKKLVLKMGDWNNELQDAWIIGVIKDYTFNPLLGKDSRDYGIVLSYENGMLNFLPPKRLSIRLATENIQRSISSIEKTYKVIFPGSFNWYFLDDHINRHYRNEKKARNQILLFTALAIAIACLGLLGMISNKVVEKTKEIGIRKVLGAQLHQIAQILLNTTIRQVIIATVIGIPVAYYLTQQYLEKFSERITLQWWHFALPVVILIVIMFVTIASVLWKASRQNPVEALKYE